MTPPSKNPDDSSPKLPVDGGEAVLTMPCGKTVSLPVLIDAYGAQFVDIRRLQPETGICTYDDGFSSTASCISKITWIDGTNGILRYRGYDVADLANLGDFDDAAYVLLHGDLPTPAQKASFHAEVTRHTMVRESVLKFFQGFHADAHPMAMLCSVVAALSSFYSPACEDLADAAMRRKSAMRLISKVPTLAAAAFRYSRGQPFVYPRNSLSYAENFLHMLFATPAEPYVVDKIVARALEKILILHLDHEQNASTSTVRTAGSSQANPFACIAAGVSSLWGPAHGGANEACLRMLLDIGSVENIPKALARAKDKSDPWRLFGFGHRVYKSHDPRATVMKGVTRELLAHLGCSDDPALKVAVALEEAATKDEYFVRRNLYPNVDFYSGICLRAMGIPLSLFTVVFAVGRCVGWSAQWMEMAAAAPGAAPKIARPRQVYTGETARPFLPAHDRGGGCACPGCSIHRAGSGGKLLSPSAAAEGGGGKGDDGGKHGHQHQHQYHHHDGHVPQPVPAVAAGR